MTKRGEDLKTANHLIAIIGGAVAGAEAASQLVERGFRVVIFEQSRLPYGKIEDGLPKWHYKLRNKEEQNIDQKIDNPLVHFVPCTRLGRDIGFTELLDWGFTAIILATGAWRDRPLPIPGIDAFIGRGLYYQNPFVHWFNHYHEPDYSGVSFEIKDNAIVIGGGLASLDVVKILMIETVSEALRKRGIDHDLFMLEHGIRKVLEEHNLGLEDLGLKGCTLFYRRRAMDMPLSPMPTDTREKLEKAQVVRQKILDNFQRKYLFKFEPCCTPVEMITDHGELKGIKFQRTKVEKYGVAPLPGQYLEIETPLVIASIGSIPEMIEGIPNDRDVYRISNPDSCQIDGFNHVFAIGNAVTGKGNILESIKHSREISSEIGENFLEWQHQDYQNWHRQTTVKVDADVEKIINRIQKLKAITDEQYVSIMEKVLLLQRKAGYNGVYKEWIQANIPVRLEDIL